MGWLDSLNPLKWLTSYYEGIGGFFDMFTGASANSANKQMTKQTNETNLQIANNTNQLQRDLFNQQIGEQWKMWNAQNAYNSPAAQKERLKQAGINPVLGMMSNGDVGNASAMTAPQAPQMQRAEMQAPHVNPLDASQIVNAVLGSANTAADVAMKGAQTRGQNIQNSFGAQRALQDLTESMARTRDYLARADLTQVQRLAAYQNYNVDKMTFNELIQGRKLGILETAQRIENMKQERNLMLSQQNLTQFELLAKKAKLPIELDQLKASVNQIYTQIDNISMNTKLTHVQALHEARKAVKTEFEAVGVYISNEYAGRMAELALNTKEAELEKLTISNESYDLGLFKFPHFNQVRRRSEKLGSYVPSYAKKFSQSKRSRSDPQVPFYLIDEYPYKPW